MIIKINVNSEVKVNSKVNSLEDLHKLKVIMEVNNLVAIKRALFA